VYAACEGHYSSKSAEKYDVSRLSFLSFELTCIRSREAGRCIKILDTLSLRGSFWYVSFIALSKTTSILAYGY